MRKSRPLLQTILLAGLGLVPAACARQARQPGMQEMPNMQGQGIQGHSMQSVDMQTMMKQCADMRRQMAEGTHPNTPEMAQMMTHCDEMDRSMSNMGNMPGMGSAAPSAAPAATRSR